MQTEPRFDLVIFDCDGTLIDSEDASDEIVANLMADLGLAVTPTEVRQQTQGISDREMWSVFGHLLGRRVPSYVRRKYLDLESEAIRKTAAAIPGVEEILTSLVGHDLPFCIASSGTKTKMRLSLRVTGLAKYFSRERIFSASQVRQGKPAPDLFMYAAEQMRTPPERCAVIEDSPVGVRAGVAARMTVFAFCPRGESSEHAAAGAHVFGRMEDLPELLGLGSLSMPSTEKYPG